eukprot:scaffold100439_cov16-Tisochrysis_lutea.AAC.3
MTLNCYTSTKCGCSRHKGRAGGVGSHRLFHRLQRAYRRMVRSQPLVGSQAAACTEAHRRLQQAQRRTGYRLAQGRMVGLQAAACTEAHRRLIDSKEDGLIQRRKVCRSTGCSRHRGTQEVGWFATSIQ